MDMFYTKPKLASIRAPKPAPKPAAKVAPKPAPKPPAKVAPKPAPIKTPKRVIVKAPSPVKLPDPIENKNVSKNSTGSVTLGKKKLLIINGAKVSETS